MGADGVDGAGVESVEIDGAEMDGAQRGGSVQGPLAGVRVVDLSQMLAGPYTTMLLADLGAEVVKVEPPTGDPARAFGPFHPDDELRSHGGYFQSINRGKRSIALDLKAPEGRDLVGRLVDGADVVVENFRVGVMERLGLAYERLAERNPGLVYAAVRGFGDPRTGESPYAAWPAFDLTAQAMGGFMSITGLPDQPLKAGPGIGDLFPGTLLALGVVSALQERERSGRGQFVDVAMFDAVLSLCERIVHQHTYTGEVPGRVGNDHPLLSPFDVLPTRDGHVTIASPTDGHWRALCDVMERPDLGEDPRFSTNADRLSHAAELRDLCAGWTQERTTAEVVAQLAGRVPVGPVNDVAAIVADPHARARDMVVAVEHPGVGAEVAVAGSAIKLSRTPTSVRGRAPLLGEHTRAEAAAAGLAPGEVEELLAAGVLVTT
jgi:crotonobetainyl-CoA:carnitine CoA-transferase CaiB-like acyl-CoA transferase